MSNRIKEAVSVVVALALVAAMQYLAAKDSCRLEFVGYVSGEVSACDPGR